MSPQMKTLVILPADASLNPLGASSSVADARVSVVYDRDVWVGGQPVPRVPIVETSIPTAGLRVPVLASDDPSITEGAGFVIKVVVETTPRIGPHNETGTRLARTIQVVTADPAEIPLGSKSSLTQVADPAQYADVMSAITAAAEAKAAAAQVKASAATMAADVAASKTAATQAASSAASMVKPTDAGVSSVIASGTQTGAAFANMLADPDSTASVALSHTYVRQDCLAGLTAWRVAYHTRGLKAARIMVLSGHEGVGATSTATRFTKLLQDRLRKGEPGGLGWVNAAQSVASIPQATTVTGPTKVYTVGKGISGTTLNLDNGATATFPATTCTSVKVYYTKQATFAGNADVLIDGTKVGTLSSSGGDIDGQVATFTVTRGSHVVSIQGVADGANNFPLEAVEFLDGDENSGVHVIDATTQDQKIKEMTTTWYSWDTGRWVATRALNPDLILVYAGDADWLANGIALIDTAVQALIDKINNSTTGPRSILFVMPPRPVPKSGSQAGTPEEYAYLQKLLQSVALANPDRVAFFDMGTQWPRLQAGDSGLGLMSDPANPQHYSDKGNTFLAAILANLLAG